MLNQASFLSALCWQRKDCLLAEKTNGARKFTCLEFRTQTTVALDETENILHSLHIRCAFVAGKLLHPFHLVVNPAH